MWSFSAAFLAASCAQSAIQNEYQETKGEKSTGIVTFRAYCPWGVALVREAAPSSSGDSHRANLQGEHWSEDAAGNQENFTAEAATV